MSIMMKHPESVSDFLEQTAKLRDDFGFDKNDRFGLWFRDQERAHWPLCPKFEIPNSKVTVNACSFEIPESMLSQFGLDQFKADGHDSSVQSRLTATMSTSGPADSSPTGQPAAHALTIGLTPNLTADKTAVNLMVNAQVVGPSGSTLAR